MLFKHDSIKRDHPANHLVRKMEAAIVFGTIVTLGNTHDSHILEPLVGQVIEKVGKPEAAAADAASKTPAITSYLFGHKITPALPYSRPRTKEGFFCKHDYVYDEHFDCYPCPSDEILKYSTTNKEGYLEYKSPKHICVTCPFLSKCTESKDLAMSNWPSSLYSWQGISKGVRNVLIPNPFCLQTERVAAATLFPETVKMNLHLLKFIDR
ncbi:hypothetical protein OKW24_001683 [Peribacillus simplex]|nr:hypothetical protein [Peribacillus simplex]